MLQVLNFEILLLKPCSKGPCGAGMSRTPQRGLALGGSEVGVGGGVSVDQPRRVLGSQSLATHRALMQSLRVSRI